MRSLRERIPGVPACEKTFLLDFAGQPGSTVLGSKRGRAFAERLGVVREHRELLHHLVLGRQKYARGPEDGVDPCREDLNRIGDGGRILAGKDRKRHTCPLRSADPVLLHRQYFFGPLAQTLDALQQIVRVLRDLEEPLLQISRRDRRAAAPAPAVHDLLVGEDGLILFTPVHGRAPAVRQSALVHLDEQPLVPLVVRRLARGELAVPGIADAQTLELPFHMRDVGKRRRLGMNAALDGGVFSRQPECVPAERMQHVVAAQPLRARHDVADDVVADVSDVRMARRVREHLEAVVLRARRVFSDLERARARPAVLPFLVEGLGL